MGAAGWVCEWVNEADSLCQSGRKTTGRKWERWNGESWLVESMCCVVDGFVWDVKLFCSSVDRSREAMTS